MRFRALAFGIVLSMAPALAADGEITLSPERQAFLEGEWKGVTVDTNANKLCAKDGPQATVFSFEFLRSGGMAFLDNGEQKESGRRKIASASENDGLIDIQLEGQMAAFTFRKDGPDRMALVRNSPALGMAVDIMVFKRCRPAGDRSNIALNTEVLKSFAVEMLADLPYFIDSRIASKVPNACSAPQVQYVFFGLLGPSEFRVSRWNSFDLSDALDAKKKPAFPIDATGDWLVQAANEKDGAVVLTVRDYDKTEAQPFTLTLQAKGDGRVAIPEWNREYVRCKGFDKRS